jgi:hypothetical protein
MHKIDKAEAHYSIGHQTSHVGKASPAIATTANISSLRQSPASQLGTCQRVSGAINKVYWYRLFARAHSK